MAIKVDLTRDERKAYYTQKLKATTDDQRWTFCASFTDDQLEELEEEIKEMLDTRTYKTSEAAFPFIEHIIFSKMKFTPSKVLEFDISGLKLLPEVVQAFREKIGDLIGIATYKPAQKTFAESAKLPSPKKSA